MSRQYVLDRLCDCDAYAAGLILTSGLRGASRGFRPGPGHGPKPSHPAARSLNPNLRTVGLEAAVSDLAAPLRGRGVSVEIAIHADPRPPAVAERLLYRAAREALRNVQLHAQAREVRVEVARTGGAVSLSVVDDGRGPSPALRAERRAQGHMGLDLLEGLVVDAGGAFSFGRDGQGRTRLEVVVP